jgi:hypothetical protein
LSFPPPNLARLILLWLPLTFLVVDNAVLLLTLTLTLTLDRFLFKFYLGLWNNWADCLTWAKLKFSIFLVVDSPVFIPSCLT